jgi:hypothetical protein
MKRKWTPEAIVQWQEFYNNASRLLIYGHAGNFSYETLPRIPKYKDLKPPECKRGIPSLAIRHNSLILFTLLSFITTILSIFS